MARFYYIIFIILTGFFLTPVQSYACGTESDKTETSCNKQSDSEVDNKETCNNVKEHCGKHGKDCDGKCGNPNCHCPTNGINFTIPFFAQLSLVKVIFIKPNFYYQETHYSSGILSIWLPPKIS